MHVFTLLQKIVLVPKNMNYTILYPEQFEATQTLLSSLLWNKHWGSYKATAAAYIRLHSDRFELFRQMEAAPEWYTTHNYHLSDVTGKAI